MMIGKNIAQFRKKKGLTQDELVQMVGVTNQAVSKWESGVSMPDIMILPSLADALGVTLENLYGIGKKTENDKNTFDPDGVNDFPHNANRTVIDFFARETNYCNTGIFQMYEIGYCSETGRYENIKRGGTFGCVSYDSGAAFISNDLSIVDSSFNVREGVEVFKSVEIASCIKKLSDPFVRKIIAYLYPEAFTYELGGDIFDTEFLLTDVSKNCEIPEETVLEAIEKLISIQLVGASFENGVKYTFKRTKVIELSILLTALRRFVSEEIGWGCGNVFYNKPVEQ